MSSSSGSAALGGSKTPVDSGTAEPAAAANTAAANTGAANTAGAEPEAPGGARPGAHDAGPAWTRFTPPAVAFLMCLWGITTPSFWRDEAATIAAVRRPFGDLFRMLGNVDAVHSLYYVLMWPLVHLFGSGEFVMRLPSALAAAVTAAAVAAIGRRVYSPWAGLAAGLFFAVLPVVSRYGQEARPYALVIALATVASYLLVRVLGAEPAQRRRWLIGYGASVAVLGIANIFGLLLIPAHAVTVALELRRRAAGTERTRLAAGWLAAVVSGVVVTSPMLVIGWMQKGQVSWIGVNRSSSGPGTLLTLSGSAVVTAVVFAVIVIAVVLSSQAGGVRSAVSRWRIADLSLPWMVLPPAILFGASVISPIYTSRYVLMCIPAVALLGGAAIVALGRVAGPVALVVVAVAGLTTQLTQRAPYGHYDNIRALDKIVAANARPGDVVLYPNPNAESFGAAYSYGLAKLPDIDLAKAAIPSGTLAGTSVPLPELRSRLRQVSRVWVVEINKCVAQPRMLALSGQPVGPALDGLPFGFVRMWHERGDWLLLFSRGAGAQAAVAACAPAPKS
ncbi:MAG TPA: glycosyltransferase family 39 protein [Streptosporangiaceae bacterium]|nr:glycosyltransferase family 39 protein [Streptosporangiaceae bacterium]